MLLCMILTLSESHKSVKKELYNFVHLHSPLSPPPTILVAYVFEALSAVFSRAAIENEAILVPVG